MEETFLRKEGLCTCGKGFYILEVKDDLFDLLR